MIDLEAVEWSEFNIAGKEGLFTIVSSSSEIDKKNLTNSDNERDHLVPYVTRSGASNGVNMFVSREQDEKYIMNPGNVISIGLDTQTVFYQPAPFYTGQNVHVMTHDRLNEKVAMFIIPLLEIQMEKFSWGSSGATLGRLERTKIMLPIDEEGEPAWTLMEEYTIEQSMKKRQKYEEHIRNRYENLVYQPILRLDEVEWAAFSLIDVFDTIQRGKRLTKKNQMHGETAYVSSTALNNGVDNFISNKEGVRRFSNCLTIANSGSVGATFYHKYEFVASDHVTHLKNEKMNEYTYLFVATMLNRLASKYNFNREMNDRRIKRETIMLPIDEDGKPAYSYMEQYVVNMIKNKTKQYFDHSINE